LPKLITYEERCLIEKLLKKGLSCSEIAKRINRSKNGVITEVRKNGGKEFYNAKEADKNSLLKFEEKKQKLKNINLKNTRQYYLKQRIANLEMQVEILYDTLKGLLKNDT